MGKYHRPEPLRHLVRIEGKNPDQGYDGRPGWQFRIPAWFPNGPWSEFFADADHGGSDLAQAAARARRDTLFAAEELPLRLSYMPTTSKCNSGMPGVFMDHRRARATKACSSTRWRIHWCAAWMDQPGGTKVVRRFSVNRLGFTKALELAVAERCRRTGMPAPDAEQRRQLTEYGMRKIEKIESGED